jgi:dimeric dUTPase (all-alpha-NTP-PPase superfamily)
VVVEVEKLDKLDKLFELQRRFQADLGNDISSQEYREKMIMACADELFEMLRCTPWKPWKKQQSFNDAEFRKELIDAWHFMINLSLSAGMDAGDIYSSFMKKHAINRERQKDGY